MKYREVRHEREESRQLARIRRQRAELARRICADTHTCACRRCSGYDNEPLPPDEGAETVLEHVYYTDSTRLHTYPMSTLLETCAIAFTIVDESPAAPYTSIAMMACGIVRADDERWMRENSTPARPPFLTTPDLTRGHRQLDMDTWTFIHEMVVDALSFARDLVRSGEVYNAAVSFNKLCAAAFDGARSGDHVPIRGISLTELGVDRWEVEYRAARDRLVHKHARRAVWRAMGWDSPVDADDGALRAEPEKLASGWKA